MHVGKRNVWLHIAGLAICCIDVAIYHFTYFATTHFVSSSYFERICPNSNIFN